MASVRERTGANGKLRWRAQVRVQGHEPQTRTFDRKTDAKAWAEEVERLIRAGRFRVVNEAQARDFGELCQRFKAKYMRPSRAKDYTQILDWWDSRLCRLRLINITSETVQKHLDELMASPSTSRRSQRAQAAPGAPYTPVHAYFGIRPCSTVQKASPTPSAPPTPGPRSKAKPKEPKLTSVGTGLRYLAVLSRVFNVAVKQLVWMDRSPVTGVTRPQHEEIRAPRTLLAKEESTLLAKADASPNRALRIVVRIALRTGMRLNEVMRLRWNDIEFHDDHALILVKKTKNKRQRRVPLVGDALSAVVALRVPLVEGHSTALLFPSKKNADKPVLIRSAWNTCLKNAGIDEFRFHDLRHTLASRLAAENYSLPRIGNVLGHVDHRSTQIYTHFASDDAVQMVAHAAKASAAAVAKLNSPPAAT